jgi:SAM-dependent methyltransferase
LDNSNGYEAIAASFVTSRGQDPHGIGASSVRNWAHTLRAGSTVLDLGCGTGIPITKTLMDAGMTVFGIDASPTMVGTFQLNFPHTRVACEPVEESLFFERTFDAVVAWGLLFLLSEQAQGRVIEKAARALKTGGKLLFTAPVRECRWKDTLTGQLSTSLGAEQYRELLSASGLSLIAAFEDEGENHYFDTLKT